MTSLLVAALSCVSTAYAATPKISVPPAPGFELCFKGNHGRCFRTERAGMFRQYGGFSDSQAFLTELEQKRLHKEVASFFAKTDYAKVRKVKSCTNAFVFRRIDKIPILEDVRCLERLKKKDSDKLLSLVTQVSLASKPL